MPYVPKYRRPSLDEGDEPCSVGELNYVITKAVSDYIVAGGTQCYGLINEAIGVLECAKLELYRRVAAPYEDKKKEENGDIYTG